MPSGDSETPHRGFEVDDAIGLFRSESEPENAGSRLDAAADRLSTSRPRRDSPDSSARHRRAHWCLGACCS